MMADSPEKSIFLNALDYDSEVERDAYLRTACGDDTQLRRDVESLIAAHERDRNPLDDPRVTPPTTVTPSMSAELEYESEQVGASIGPYRLVEQIGEGGFGLVFVAHQSKPVQRDVALKIIKPGMGSKEILARFDAERQAVAMMDHPNIARVFDAGVTDRGRPYFVMELVRGIPISDYCEQHELPLNERLRVFADVCSALHHAHQKGVIHRDLKPSNVLVSERDGRPVAKVIDFGIAKAVGQRLTEHTIFTRVDALIGTPLYMSPEQAAMGELDVDTRSDIYTLGVLLYEIITGTTPFDRERLENASYDEIRRIVRDEEPPRPSSRVTTVAASDTTSVPTSVAGSPAKVARPLTNSQRAAIRSDLDWIVMKALEKDRNRRYESAAAFASDIERFLSDEPVEARPPSTAYRLSKLARRHRVALATSGLVAGSLILGAAVSLYLARQAISERNEKQKAFDQVNDALHSAKLARQEAEDARQEAEDARKEVEGFAERLKSANQLFAVARNHFNNDQLAEAYRTYTDAVDLEPTYYRVWLQRAELLAKLHLWEDAAHDYGKALELGASVDGPEWQGVPALFVLTDHMDEYNAIYQQLLRDEDQVERSLDWNSIRGLLAAPMDQQDAMYVADRAEELSRVPPGPPRHAAPGLPGHAAPGLRMWRGQPPPSPRAAGWGPDRLPRDPHREAFDPMQIQTAQWRTEATSPEDGSPDERRVRIDPPPHRRLAGDDLDADAEPEADRRFPPRFPPPGANGPRPGPPGTGSRWLPPGERQYVAGWANLRAGRHDRAIEHLQHVLRDRWPGAPLSLALIAIAQHQSGDPETAEQSLQDFERYFDRRLDLGNFSRVQVGAPWFEWVETLVIYREATRLIRGQAAEIDSRITQLQQNRRLELGLAD